MNLYSVDTQIKDGKLSLTGIPIPNDSDVRVVIIPKLKLQEMSFEKVKKLTRSIKGNLSDTISEERDVR